MNTRVSSRLLTRQLIACLPVSLLLLGCESGEAHSVRVSTDAQVVAKQMFPELAKRESKGKSVQAGAAARLK